MFSSYFVNSGSQKSQYLGFLKLIGVYPRMPPKPIPTRWTSTFSAVEYHKEILPYEKSFLDLEEDMSRLQEFLKSNYKTLNFQSRFIVLRGRQLLLSMQIVKSDSCIGFLSGAILEKKVSICVRKIVSLTNPFKKRLIQSRKHLRVQKNNRC